MLTITIHFRDGATADYRLTAAEAQFLLTQLHGLLPEDWPEQMRYTSEGRPITSCFLIRSEAGADYVMKESVLRIQFPPKWHAAR